MRRISNWLVVAALGVIAAPACSNYASHVESDTALGRVVVYRNGIAFYERRARVTNNKLSLVVPSDKVNDFLKSLTVTDAKTGEAMPISYPTKGASRGRDVDMTIQLPPGPPRDVILTYITEAPAWKPSYRLMLGEDGQVKVQGWAIVDNTSGEDWKQVRVGVGSSSAMSFKYDLRSVRNVYRETLESKRQFAVAPPRGGASYGDQKAGRAEFSLADADIPKPVGHPSYKPKPAKAAHAVNLPSSAGRLAGSGSRAKLQVAESRRVSRKKTGRRGKYRWGGKNVGGGLSKGKRARRPSPSSPRVASKSAPARPSPKDARRYKEEARRAENERQQSLQKAAQAQAKVRGLAAQLKGTRGALRIEGFSNKGERSARAQSLSRANNLRNQLIKYGVAPGRLQVTARGWVRGRGAGVRIVNDGVAQGPKNGTVSASASGDGSPVGESHFLSESKLTVPRGTSALVSILDAKTGGESVYLYTADGKRGNKRYAFKSVRFKNPTDSTLETGPVTVYGQGRFIGEGLADPIPPGATAIVPYALDRQIVVDREAADHDRISKLVSLQRGILTAEVQHVKTTKLKITNRLHTATKVYVRHSLPKGWKLVKSPKVFDKLGVSYLFEIGLKRGETKTIVVVQATPLQKTLSLRSPRGIDLIRVYLNAPQNVSEEFASKMKAILGIHAEMANHKQAIQSLRERMGEYRGRMNELHTQIVSLKEVKAGGGLLKHLQKKLKEISERVQKATLDVVSHQEKAMVARVRFQDAIAELTLAKPSPSEKVSKKVSKG